MKPQHFHYTFLLLIFLSISLIVQAQTVDIPDPILIEETLDKEAGVHRATLRS